jgi:hypothetical protein
MREPTAHDLTHDLQHLFHEEDDYVVNEVKSVLNSVKKRESALLSRLHHRDAEEGQIRRQLEHAVTEQNMHMVASQDELRSLQQQLRLQQQHHVACQHDLVAALQLQKIEKIEKAGLQRQVTELQRMIDTQQIDKLALIDKNEQLHRECRSWEAQNGNLQVPSVLGVPSYFTICFLGAA